MLPDLAEERERKGTKLDAQEAQILLRRADVVVLCCYLLLDGADRSTSVEWRRKPCCFLQNLFNKLLWCILVFATDALSGLFGRDLDGSYLRK